MTVVQDKINLCLWISGKIDSSRPRQMINIRIFIKSFNDQIHWTQKFSVIWSVMCYCLLVKHFPQAYMFNTQLPKACGILGVCGNFSSVTQLEKVNPWKRQSSCTVSTDMWTNASNSCLNSHKPLHLSFLLTMYLQAMGQIGLLTFNLVPGRFWIKATGKYLICHNGQMWYQKPIKQ